MNITMQQRRSSRTSSSRSNNKSRNRHGDPSRRNNRRSGSFKSRGRSGRSRFPSKNKQLDVKLFMNDVVELTPEEQHEIKHSFADFSFDPRLMENITRKGYVTPTPIQDQTIKPALRGKDILGMANTGTGKTAAFVLPIINKLLSIKQQETRVLVIAPTRELAQQIDQEFKSFTGGLRLYSTICVGGLSIHKQKTQLRRKPHVVVGTPGRLKDLLQQGALKLQDITMFVLDEVDLMLDMGFLDDIMFLVKAIPAKRQTLCFSATMTNTIERLISTVTNDPISVSVKTGDTSANVQQDVVYTKNSKDKWNKLVSMLGKDSFEKTLIFCDTKSFVQRICDDLIDMGIDAEAIHGDKSQPQRQRALKKFKDNTVQILVATDVAARGLDIPNVSHVINYDAPRVYEDYVHRIGRTGRAGKLGNAITFVKQAASH
jgi:superfamily II DNA/RNA helicase